jgi:hypothetical protein
MRLPALVLILSLTFAAPSLAQDRDAARRLELAERYITLSMGDNVEKLVGDLIEQELATSSDIPAEERAWMRANMPPLLVTAIERMARDLAPIYAETFTLEELEALADFYATPLGQTIARKQFEVAAREEEVLAVALSQFFEDFATKYCQAFSCDAPEIVPGTSKR